jgi:hypothetical protein
MDERAAFVEGGIDLGEARARQRQGTGGCWETTAGLTSACATSLPPPRGGEDLLAGAVGTTDMMLQR